MRRRKWVHHCIALRWLSISLTSNLTDLTHTYTHILISMTLKLTNLIECCHFKDGKSRFAHLTDIRYKKHGSLSCNCLFFLPVFCYCFLLGPDSQIIWNTLKCEKFWVVKRWFADFTSKLICKLTNSLVGLEETGVFYWFPLLDTRAVILIKRFHANKYCCFWGEQWRFVEWTCLHKLFWDVHREAAIGKKYHYILNFAQLVELIYVKMPFFHNLCAIFVL